MLTAEPADEYLHACFPRDSRVDTHRSRPAQPARTMRVERASDGWRGSAFVPYDSTESLTFHRQRSFFFFEHFSFARSLSRVRAILEDHDEYPDSRSTRLARPRLLERG